MYGKDGRMMVLIARSDRPKPENIDKITDEQRNRLFSSMISYAGTYKFDGKTIEHHIDLSWNEVWSATMQARDIKKDGDRLIYTTRPAPSPLDGTMGFATLIWERVSKARTSTTVQQSFSTRAPWGSRASCPSAKTRPTAPGAPRIGLR